jgi:hypothetical protein
MRAPALLLADAQAADLALGIELEAVVAADLGEPGARPGAVAETPGPALADHQVFDHAEARHQVEMLMHHADAGGQRVGGPADRGCPAVDADDPGIGAVDAEQHVHQRGLAGAVLAQQADHLAAAQGQVHAPIGLDRAERLVDPA